MQILVFIRRFKDFHFLLLGSQPSGEKSNYPEAIMMWANSSMPHGETTWRGRHSHPVLSSSIHPSRHNSHMGEGTILDFPILASIMRSKKLSQSSLAWMMQSWEIVHCGSKQLSLGVVCLTIIENKNVSLKYITYNGKKNKVLNDY